MSHFNMAIIMDEKPTEESIAKVIAPWHEFECTGLDNEYVKDFDITEEQRKEHADHEEYVYTDPEGVHHGRFQEQFKQPPEPGKAGDRIFSGNTEYVCPEGWVEGMIPTKMTFREFVEDYHERECLTQAEFEVMKAAKSDSIKYGYAIVDDAGEIVKIIRRSNDNAKWDWWVLGGRYKGKLIAKPGADTLSGRRGTGDSSFSNGVDVCQFKDLDLKAMYEYRRNMHRKAWAEVVRETRAKFPGSTEEQLAAVWGKYRDTSASLRKRWEDEEDSGAFHKWIDDREAEADEEAVFLRSEMVKAMTHTADWRAGMEAPTGDIKAWIDGARPMTCWGFVRDGEWFEKGEMGWWGMSNDEFSEEQWHSKCSDMFGEMDPEKWIAMIDCHI